LLFNFLDGGGLHIHLGPNSNKVTLKYCFFINCTAENGGSLFVDFSELNYFTLFSLEHCFFENNSNSISPENFQIFVDPSILESVISPLFSTCFSSDKTITPTLVTTLVTPDSNYYVSMSSPDDGSGNNNDVFPCGEMSVGECRSIKNAVSSSGLYSDGEKSYVVVRSGSYIEEPIVINYGEKDIKGEAKETTMIKYNPLLYSPLALFSVGYHAWLHMEEFCMIHNRLNEDITNVFINYGRLEIVKCEITSNGTEVYFGALLMLLAGSSTGIRDVVVQNFSLSCSSVIEANNTLDVNIVNCTFRNIKKTKGNGAVVQAKILDGTSFTMSNISFNNCSSPDGVGGCVYVYFDDNFGGTFVLGGPSLNFVDVDAFHGKAVFVDSWCRKEVVMLFNICFNYL
jgi:hypothetical protein